MAEKYEGKIESREFLPSEDGGMGISGVWLNKQTGAKINVRNSIMDGDNMIIITDRGQISMNDFSRDYIQASDEIYDESGKVVGHEEVTIEDYGQDADWADIQAAMAGIPGSHPQTPQPGKTAVNTNDQIIKKVFDKLTSYPKIDVDIKWDEFPEAQIRTLVDYLEISVDDISTYIIKNYVNIEALSLAITEILNSKLDKKNIEEQTNE